MLLQEPPHTAYDLRFQVLGFPVRIAWTFWLGGLLIGLGFVRGIDSLLLRIGSSPGMLPLLLLWFGCLLLSILIHELGHALAFRQCGIQSAIVLYHFGGLAIPISSYNPGRSFGGLSEKENIWISFAGPLAQFLSAVAVIVAVVASGYMPEVPIVGSWLRENGYLQGASLVTASPGLFALTTLYILPSVFWSLLNLVPVYPLDGGQICRSMMVHFGGTTIQALWVSVVAGGLMAAYGFANGQQLMGFLFLILAVTNFQAIQQSGSSYY